MRIIVSLAILSLLAACGSAPGPQAKDRPEIQKPGKACVDPPVVPPVDASAARVPDGFRVEVAVDGLIYPTSIDFDDAGAMYIAEAGVMDGDPIAPARILKLSCDDGQLGQPQVVAEQLQGPVTDILWHQDKLYISHKGKISVLADGKVRDLVIGLPSFGDHSNNQLAIGPDGKLYFGQGSATNSGVVGLDNYMFGWLAYGPELRDIPAKSITLAESSFRTPNPFHILTTGRLGRKVATSAFRPFGETAPENAVVLGDVKANGTVLRCDLDGSHLEMVAWGLRNPFGVQWSPDGKLFVAENNYDERGSRPVANAPECLHIIKEGGWYGWPDFVAGVPVTDPQFRSALGPAPQFLMAKHPPVEKPFTVFEPHASLCKIDFSKGTAFGPEGSLFIAASGDYTAVTAVDQKRAGFYVARVDPKTGEKVRFFQAKPESLGPKDQEYVTTPGPKRLIDVRFSPDGKSLYVVDYGAVAWVRTAAGPQPKPYPGSGVVWKITAEPMPIPDVR